MPHFLLHVPALEFTTNAPPKTNMDTQNDGLEKATQTWQFLVSMLVFRGVLVLKNKLQVKSSWLWSLPT